MNAAASAGLPAWSHGLVYELANWAGILVPAGIAAIAAMLWLAWRDRWFAAYPVSTIRAAPQGRVRLRGSLRTVTGHPSAAIGHPPRAVAAWRRTVSRNEIAAKVVRGNALLALSDGTGQVLIPEGSVDLRRPKNRKRWFAKDPNNIYTSVTRKPPRGGLVALPGESVVVDEQWVEEGDEVTVMAQLKTVQQDDQTEDHWVCGYQSGRRGDMVLVYGRDPLALSSEHRLMIMSALCVLSAVSLLSLFAAVAVRL